MSQTVNNTPVREIGNPNELFHHGVLGQKWGTRNGPPYPLKPGQHSASEKKAGWQKSLSGGRVYGSTEKEPAVRRKDADIDRLLSQRKLDYKKVKEIESDTLYRDKAWSDVAAVITAASAVTLAAATMKNKGYAPAAAVSLGVAALSGAKMISNNVALSREKSAIEARDKKHLKKDEKSGLYLKNASDRKMTMLDDAKAVNPAYGLFSEGRGASNNCVLCSVTYDMRRRGYDVIAQRTPYGRHIENTVLNWYKGCTQEQLKLGNATKATEINSRVQDSMKKVPDGARGVFSAYTEDLGIAHAMAFEKSNGVVKIIDAQNGTEVDIGSMLDGMGKINASYMRLDNCTPDYDAIREGAVK